LLNANLLPRFTDEAVACGMTHAKLDNWVDGYAVAQRTFFILNESLLRVNDLKFPHLNVVVEEEHPTNITLTNSAVKRDICVSWILPPLNAMQSNRLIPFQGLASKTFLAFGQQGYDPKTGNTSFWKTAGLSFGSLNSVSIDYLEGFDKHDKDAFFPVVEFRLSFWERNQLPVPENFETFTSVYLQENLVDAGNPANPIVPFIDGYIEPNVTITSCTPNTGSIQGQTLIAIQGTGFLPGKIIQLSVCGASITNFMIQSQTMIVAITVPGIIGISTGDVVLTDNLGNSYALVNGYTYTTP